eukprot:1506609-Pleurochrysis_carterae.AAC.1
MVRTDARNEPIGRLEENVMRNTEGSKCPNSSERGSQRPRRELHTNVARVCFQYPPCERPGGEHY